MRVLGVDPGLTRCGIGVVEGEPGRQPAMVDVDVFRTSTSLPTPSGCCPFRPTSSPGCRYHPDAIAIERVFADVNVSSVMGTAQASAVAMLAAASARHPGPPAYADGGQGAAVTGSGRADKAQVTAMVTRLLRLAEPPKPADAADALALAICQVGAGEPRPGSTPPSPPRRAPGDRVRPRDHPSRRSRLGGRRGRRRDAGPHDPERPPACAAARPRRWPPRSWSVRSR